MDKTSPKRSITRVTVSYRMREILAITRIHFGPFIAIVLLSIIGTVFGHVLYTPSFSSTASLDVESPSKISVAKYMALQFGTDLNNDSYVTLENYARRLTSESFLLSVAQEMKYGENTSETILVAPRSSSIFKTQAWKDYLTRLSPSSVEKQNKKRRAILLSVEEIAAFIRSVTKTTVHLPNNVSVTVTTQNPQSSMIIANSIVQRFYKIVNSHGQSNLSEIKEFLLKKITQTKINLKKDEMNFINFKKQHQMSSSSNTLSSPLGEKLRQIENTALTYRLKFDENSDLINRFITFKKKNIENQIDSNGSKDSHFKLLALKQQLESLRNQKSIIATLDYKEDDWRVISLEENMKELVKQIATLEKQGGDIDGLEGIPFWNLGAKIKQLEKENYDLKIKIETLGRAKKDFLKKVARLPQIEQKFFLLKRKVDKGYASFLNLERKLDELAIQEASVEKIINIHQLANLPKGNQQLGLPSKLVYAILIGLFFGFLTSYFFEYIDYSIRHRSDLEDLDIVFLGEIPNVLDADNTAKKQKNKYGKYVRDTLKNETTAYQNPSSLSSLAFDFIRSRFESYNREHNQRVQSLLITSVGPSEGKSFVASNLAVCMASAGKKVVLIDCDLRCPSIRHLFNISNTLGLVHLFESNQHSLDDIIIPQGDGKPDIITAGWSCENPVIIFSSKKFQLFLYSLQEHYDHIIIDSAPINLVPDAGLISQLTDGVLFVTRNRVTATPELIEAKDKIHRALKDRTFGVINFKSSPEYVASYYPYAGKYQYVQSHADTVKINGDENDFKNRLKIRKA